MPSVGDSALDRLIADGRVRPAARSWEDLPAPLPRRPGEPTLTEVMLALRDEAGRRARSTSTRRAWPSWCSRSFESAALRSFLAGGRLASSALLEVELTRAVLRSDPSRLDRAEKVISALFLIELDEQARRARRGTSSRPESGRSMQSTSCGRQGRRSAGRISGLRRRSAHRLRAIAWPEWSVWAFASYATG